MNNKVYRIRDKKTGEFISLGYRSKTSWLVKPNAAMKEYPELFKDRHADMKTTAMCWGFECLDGWYPLINSLCAAIMWNPHTGKNVENPPTVSQVKEKYGTLRFYVNDSNERQNNIIEFAEYLSGNICENCGSMRDVSRTKGWVKTRCLTCHQEAGDIPYGN